MSLEDKFCKFILFSCQSDGVVQLFIGLVSGLEPKFYLIGKIVSPMLIVTANAN